MRKIFLALLALLMIPIVHAAVDVTYVFNQNNVNVSVYNCLDANCDQVGTFGGSIIKGPNVTDGKITIRYPDTMNTHGYAEFFVSNGFVPLEGRHNWHTFGQPGLGAPQTETNQFYQLQTVCRAVVSQLNFVNELQPNVPLVVNTTARLDAQTASAFQLTNNNVGYVPPEFKQEHYGADTIVKMEVLQSGVPVHNQQQEFTAIKGNALIASSSVPVQFKYLPSGTGSFVVKVTAQVVDGQCASWEDVNAQGNFNVLSAQPTSQFYTILNSLTVNNTYPKVGEQVLVTYNKITNHANGVLGPLTPVQTDADYIVKNGASTLLSTTTTLFANPDATTPVTYSFTFTPTSAGVHTITVKGRANSALTVTNPEITDEESMQLTVYGPSTHKVTFNVRNADTGEGVLNASVTLTGIGTNLTDSNGKATLSSVPEGTYTYTVSAFNFSTKKDTVKVVSDQTISVVLHPGENATASNTPPFMNLPSTLQIQAGTTASFNYFDYVQDDQDQDSSLKLTVTGGNTSISVDINSDGRVTFIPATGFTGTNTITFRLNDTQNAIATDSITVTVAAAAGAPTFSPLPQVITPEDTAAVRVMNLRNFATDPDTPAANLIFTVTSITPSTLATAQIDSGQYLSVFPRANANGAGTITVNVTDGVNSATGTIALNVTPVNDAPVVISIPKIPNLNESTNYTLNLSLVFFDADNDPLTFNVTPTFNVTFLISNSTQTITIVPDFNVFGTRTFNVTAIDPSGLSAKATFTLFLNFVDDAPFLNMVIPNILTFEEIPNSIDLTPFENDPEDGPGANNNNLTWKMQLANQSNQTLVTAFNHALFNATITTATDFLLIQPNVNQTGLLDIILFLFDATGKNVSQNITVNITNVNDAPAFVNLSNQNAQAGVLFTYDVNATDSDPTNDTLTFSSNSTIFTINSATGLINFTPSTNGVFPTLLTVCDNFNACRNGTFTLTISDTLAPTAGNQTTPPNPSVYAPGANYTFSINWTDNGNITNVTFQIGSITVTNVTQTGTQYDATVSDLAAGNYTFSWTARDGANNVNMTNTSNFIVLQANSSMALTLNGTASNITVAQNAVVPITANLTNTTGTVSTFRNGTLLGSGASPFTVNQTFPTAGLFNITATFAGNQNYTGTSQTLFVTVSDTTAPVFGTQTASPTSPATFTSLYTFSAVVTDNVAVSTATFELDNSTNTTATQVGNTSTYQVNLTSLSVGNHTFRWYASDAAGNVNSTTPTTYTVTAGTAVITLTINGVSGATSAQVNDTVTIVANVTNPAGGPVEIYTNGTLALNSTSSPATHVTSFASTGTIQITAVFPGNANVSNGSITRLLTITPIIMQSNITPASGASFNYSTFILALDTNGATTCRWSFSDVAQGSMTNNFSTANGLQHTANVTGYTLGPFTMSVACNNQSALTNSDLSYLSQNILDGSTLLGTNTVNNTIMTVSTINASSLQTVTGLNNGLHNVTATSSTINNSVLRNCVVTNSTVKNITATGCNFSNSFVDPSDLTGSTITQSSTIIASNVTFSNVTNSTITNSNINNSNIVGSVIANSQFNNAVVSNANITNNAIFSGAISVTAPNGTIFSYNASTSGATNLSNIIPLPPVASFTPASGTSAPNAVVTFTSTSFDPNANDTLSFSWNFGDGATGTGSTVAHSYTITGVFAVTLTVTDSTGFTSTAQGTRTIANPTSSGGGGGGGGSGGGGGGGAPRIALTDTPVTRIVFVGQPLQFTINGRLQALSILLRRADRVQGTTEWILNGVFHTIAKGAHKTFDLSKDGIADLDLEVLDLAQGSATINVKLASATSATVSLPPVPSFNFTPIEETQPEVPQVEQVQEPQPETTETTVPVTTEVKQGMFSKMGKALKDFFTFDLEPGSTAVKAGIVFAVVIIGLVAYGFFVRWESF